MICGIDRHDGRGNKMQDTREGEGGGLITHTDRHA